MTARSLDGSLHDLNDAMSLLNDVDDQVTELALGLRDATARRTTPKVELLAALSLHRPQPACDVTHVQQATRRDRSVAGRKALPSSASSSTRRRR